MSMYYFYDGREAVPFRYLSPTRFVSSLPPPHSGSLSTRTLVHYAIADIADGTERGRINAFANAKRALHLCIDALLQQFGLLKHSAKRNFPTKLALLDEVDLLPTTIVHNLNVERNLLEHEYAAPSQERAREAVDVARFVQMCVDHSVERTTIECFVGWLSPARHVLMRLEALLGQIELYGVRARREFYTTIHGQRCFRTGKFRLMGDGSIARAVRVSRTPWRVIEIRTDNKQEWLPIIRELIGISAGARPSSYSEPNSGQWTMAVTTPLNWGQYKTIAEVVDETVSRSRERRKKTKTARPGTKRR